MESPGHPPLPTTLEERIQEIFTSNQKIVDGYVRWLDDATRELAEDLSKRDISQILHLGDAGTLTMSALAQRTVLPLSTATFVVDKLEKKRLVRRRRSTRDRRVVEVALTRKGRVLYEGVRATAFNTIRASLLALTDQEQDTLLRLERKIVDSLLKAAR